MMVFLVAGHRPVKSPDELARRELVRALMAHSSGQVPQNHLQGLNSLSPTFGGRLEEGRPDAAEAEERRSADERFRNVLTVGPGRQADDAAWLDAMSDPRMSVSRRDALNSDRQNQSLGVKPEHEFHKPAADLLRYVDGSSAHAYGRGNRLAHAWTGAEARWLWDWLRRPRPPSCPADDLPPTFPPLEKRGGNGGGTSDPDCDEEWVDAKRICDEELRKPHPNRRMTGGYRDVHNCAKGLVSQRCGGNRVTR